MRVLSLDPRIGYAIIDHDKGQYKVIFFETLNATKFPKEIRKDALNYGPGIVFFTVTREFLEDLIDKYEPDYVVTEDAFHKPGRTLAFRSLASWISFVAWILYSKFKMFLYTVSPKEIKKVITTTGDAKKFNMREGLSIFPNLSFDPTLDQTLLTEHAIDAIGVGITFLYLNKDKG